MNRHDEKAVKHLDGIQCSLDDDAFSFGDRLGISSYDE